MLKGYFKHLPPQQEHVMPASARMEHDGHKRSDRRDKESHHHRGFPTPVPHTHARRLPCSHCPPAFPGPCAFTQPLLYSQTKTATPCSWVQKVSTEKSYVFKSADRPDSRKVACNTKREAMTMTRSISK